jgi:hypothetical protein
MKIAVAIIFFVAISAIASDSNPPGNVDFQNGHLHNILEIVQALTNIAIAIIAAIGLRQIVIARRIARINANREAFKLAGDQTLFYLTHIIPSQNELSQAITDNKVTYFKAFDCQIVDKTFQTKFIGTADDLESLKKIIPELAKVLNAMEAFALFFTQGVANEKAAFSAVGETFCNQVRKLAAALSMVNAGKDSYRNLTELFFLWNDRLEAQKLSLEKDQISKKLNAITPGKIDIVGADI